MLLLTIFQPKKLNYVLLFLAFYCIGNAKTENTELKIQQDVNKTQTVVPEQKSVKKELKINLTDPAIVEITPSNEKDDHTEELAVLDEKSAIESLRKALEQELPLQEEPEKNSNLESLKNTAVSSQSPPHNQEFILSNENDISESLKTGFYFFLILSSGAIVFIIFKIYRLRLSRAERRYGVHGNRSSQELTPLPISIEDGHSDDEDHTLFEIQHKNVRIL